MLVEISCDEEPYGIAGAYPRCDKDYLIIYDGHGNQDESFGPFCHFTKPGTLKLSTNKARIEFHAGPNHSPSRKGFRCTFRSVPQSPCDGDGAKLSTASGSFQSPNWPVTYPSNVDCQWTIELPDSNKQVEIKCEDEPYGTAGSHPNCRLDHLKFYDGHSTHNDSYGPYCGWKKPTTLTMSSNLAKVVFHAGPRHSSSRKGFRCTYQSVGGPTLPPTIPLPTTPPMPQCNRTLTAASGSLQSPNWPLTYPINVDCEWKIVLPSADSRVELTFETPFGIAGSLPGCETDHLKIYDDHSGSEYGPYCHFAVPDALTMSSNVARVVFHAGPSHGPSHLGFKANYRSICGPLKVAPPNPEGNVHPSV